MDTNAATLIDALGGTTVVAKMTSAPISTVHAWRSKISPSRLNHLKLLAEKHGVPSGDTDHSNGDTATQQTSETGNGAETSAQAQAA